MSNNFINITPQISIPKGNYARIKFDDPILYDMCYEAERLIYTNSLASMRQFRLVTDKIGEQFELKKRIADRDLSPIQIQEEKERVEKEAKKIMARTFVPATVLIREINKKRKTNKEEYEKARDNGYQALKSHNKYIVNMEAGEQITALRKIMNENFVHDFHFMWEAAKTTSEVLFGYLSILYGEYKQYDSSLIPYGDYVAIPSSEYKKLNIYDEKVCLYIREDDKDIKYYVLRGDETDTDKRNNEIMKTLWDEGNITPNNIVMDNGYIGEEGCRKRVMRITAQPESLNVIANTMTENEKKDVVIAIIKTIKTLHSMNPVVTHRSLSPMSFLVCRGKNGIRPFLYDLGTAKQIGVEKDYTVIGEIDKINNAATLAPFIAPEVLSRHIKDELADKADIFSLGKIIKYMLGEEQTLIDCELLESMCDSDYNKRPNIEAVSAAITSKLASYSYSCALLTQRFTSHKQQDAFWINGYDVYMADNVSYIGKAKERCVCAIFDGLGGAHGGEIVSENAARFTSQYFGRAIMSNYDMMLKDYTSKLQGDTRRVMDDECCDYAGTTMVISVFDKDKVHIANIGDSRAYIIDDNGILKLTKDHRYTSGIRKTGELYQYIGMDEDESTLKPYITSCRIQHGNRILLCSDGLTDYVDEDIVRTIVTSDSDNTCKTEKLVKTARTNGSKDDITVIIVEVV